MGIVETDGSGRLVIVAGLPGSGKTTLAIELAERSRAMRMSPDDWMIAAGIDLWDGASRETIEQASTSTSRS